MKQYQLVFKLYDKYKQCIESLNLDELKINYQLAAKKDRSDRFSKTVLRNIYGHGDSKEVKICAYSILGQEKDAKRLLKMKIESNFIFYYRFKRWPAIDSELLKGFDKQKAA